MTSSDADRSPDDHRRDSPSARSADGRETYLGRLDAASDTSGAPPDRAVLRQPRARLCRLRARATRLALAGERGAQPRHHHLLQRHAVGASALRDLSGADQRGGARGRRRRPGGRRRAGDVRRRHPGPAGHGAVAVLARRDRHGRRRSACRTTCSTPPSISASATRSCRAW